MTEIWSANRVDTADLANLIATCEFGPKALFLVERLPAHVVRPQERLDLLRFAPFDPDDDSIRFAEYTSGRIFQPDAELRWERDGQQLHVVYMGPERSLPGLQNVAWLAQEQRQASIWRLNKEDKTQKLLKKRDSHYYLFGERLSLQELERIGRPAQPGDFAELRIPRLLRYPKQEHEKRRVRLVVAEFVDDQTGIVELFRFQQLEAVE